MNPNAEFRELACRHVDLDRMDYAVAQETDEFELERIGRSSQFETYKNHERRSMITRMHTSIYGIKHPNKHVIRYPADWWQAVKERFAPVWFRDKYPVKFISVGATLAELYPEVEPSLPDKRPVMRFVIRETPEFPVW